MVAKGICGIYFSDDRYFVKIWRQGFFRSLIINLTLDFQDSKFKMATKNWVNHRILMWIFIHKFFGPLTTNLTFGSHNSRWRIQCSYRRVEKLFDLDEKRFVRVDRKIFINPTSKLDSATSKTWVSRILWRSEHFQ